MSGTTRRGLWPILTTQGNLRPPECSPPLACLESTNLATYSSMPEQNGKQIRGWKVRKARKAFQAIPALPLRVFRQGHRTSARDCEELKFWSHSNHQSHLEVTWKSKYLCHLALFLELLTLPKRKNWSTKAPPKRSNCPGRTTEKATIQTGCNCTA